MSDDAADDSTTGDEGQQTQADTGSAWKPPASKEELDRAIAKRIASIQKRYADYDTLKEKAARADALENELSSEADKAVRSAREEERRSVLAEANPRLVRAEFRAAAKGVLSTDQLNSLLEDVDLTRFLTDTGDVDEARIAKKVAAFAPATADENKPRFPDLGGGKRGSNSAAQSMSELIRRQAGIG